MLKRMEGKVRGSITVEAALIVFMVLLCIWWMAERGILLYTQTVELARQQEMWEDFDPAGDFRRLELVQEMLE